MTGIHLCLINLVDPLDCGAVCIAISLHKAVHCFYWYSLLGLDIFYATFHLDGHLTLLELHGRRCYYLFCFQVVLSFESRSAQTSWVCLLTLRLLLIGIVRSFCLWSILWNVSLGCSLIVIQSFGLFCCGGCANLTTWINDGFTVHLCGLYH